MLEHVNIRIETNVQTIHIIVLQYTLSTIISQCEEIAGHLITSLYRNTIILRESLTVDDIVPIRIVIIFIFGFQQ